MTFIPEHVIQEVQELAEIRHIVSEYVSLQKRGNNWVGLCPFHNDRSPSFTVNEDKKIFHCFGCGVGGDVFKFLMLIEGMSFVDAVKSLANRFGVVIPEPKMGEAAKRSVLSKKRLLECTEAAAQFFHEGLLKRRIGLSAMDYLKGRGVDEETMRHFKLGWAPKGWDNLCRHLNALGLDLSTAADAGLVIKKDAGSGYYDRFRERIIFPIHDRRGNVVAFGGRVIDGGEPKYINSPETLVYKKKNSLYGYHLNKAFVRKEGFGFVVEGYMDLVALYQHGVKNVVATLGTALTLDHARLMKGLSKEWILVFDADEAGLKAAKRALPSLYSVGIRPRVMCLPEGHDPDSFIRAQGRSTWEDLIPSAEHGLDFVIRVMLEQSHKGPEAKIEASEEVMRIMEGVDDPVRKALLISHASQRLGIREDALLAKAASGMRSHSRRPLGGGLKARGATQGPRSIGKRAFNTATSKLLSFILNHPHRMTEFVDLGMEYWIEEKAFKDLWESMVHAYELQGGLDVERFLDYIAPIEGLKKVASQLIDAPLVLPDDEETVSMLKRYCESMKKKALRQRIIEQLRDHEEGAEQLLREIENLY